MLAIELSWASEYNTVDEREDAYMSDEMLTKDSKVLTEQAREVTISTGFERSVNVNYNGWKFTANLHEKHTVTGDEQEDLIRRKIHLRCVRAVYSDMLTALPIVSSASSRNPGVAAQWELVKEEAQAGLAYAVSQLEALEK